MKLGEYICNEAETPVELVDLCPVSEPLEMVTSCLSAWCSRRLNHLKTSITTPVPPSKAWAKDDLRVEGPFKECRSVDASYRTQVSDRTACISDM